MTNCLIFVIGEAETWEDVELYGQGKYKWFKKFLKLPKGIPSHDTFNRVFARLDPEQLQELLKVLYLKGAIVTIDGAVRRILFLKLLRTKLVIALRKNQIGLYQRVDQLFKEDLSQFIEAK